MALTLDFSIKQDDLLPPLLDGLKNSDSTAFDLTGYSSVNFRFRHIKSGTLYGGSATIVDAANGIVRYNWVLGDTAALGEYQGEWQVVDGTGKVETFPNTESYISFVVISRA